MSKNKNRKGSSRGKKSESKANTPRQNPLPTFGIILVLIAIGIVLSSQLEKKGIPNGETENAPNQHSNSKPGSQVNPTNDLNSSVDPPIAPETEVQYSEEMVPDMINEGTKLIQQGNIPGALKVLEAAVNFDTDWEDAYYYYARALQKSGKKEKAVQMYKKAIGIWPEYSEALNNLGNLLVDLKKYDEAIPYFQKAIESYPDKYPLAYTNMGKAYALKGEIDKAVAQFTKALELQPSNYNARINLGTALMQQNRMKDATIQFQYALKIRPNDPIALDRLRRISQQN